MKGMSSLGLLPGSGGWFFPAYWAWKILEVPQLECWPGGNNPGTAFYLGWAKAGQDRGGGARKELVATVRARLVQVRVEAIL